MELSSCERKNTLHALAGTLSHLLKVKAYDNWILVLEMSEIVHCYTLQTSQRVFDFSFIHRVST